MGGGGQQMVGQVGQAVQNGMSQGSPTVPSAPSAPVGNAYAPETRPMPMENYQDDRALPMQPQQPSWQQSPEWQGYQTQLQELQNKMQAYQQQHQPQQYQSQQYQPRSRDGWGYGGRGGSNWGQPQMPFQSSGLAGLMSAFSGRGMFKNGGKVE